MSVAENHFMPVVFYRRRWRDWFMKSYWAECVRCGKKLGPMPYPGVARLAAEMAEMAQCESHYR